MPVISLMETVLELIFKIMSWIMKVAPIGAFGAMAFIIGQYGLGTLSTYALLIAACYGAAIIFIGLLFAGGVGLRPRSAVAVPQVHPRGIPPGPGHRLHRGRDAADHDQADQRRLLPCHHRPGGSHGLLLQPRRRRDLPFHLAAVPGAGLRPQPGPRPAAGRPGRPAPDLQGHGRRSRARPSWHSPPRPPRWASSRWPASRCSSVRTG